MKPAQAQQFMRNLSDWKVQLVTSMGLALSKYTSSDWRAGTDREIFGRALKSPKGGAQNPKIDEAKNGSPPHEGWPRMLGPSAQGLVTSCRETLSQNKSPIRLIGTT